MHIHKKVNSEAELRGYVKYLIKYRQTKNLWNLEDRPKLQPFFNAQHSQGEWTNEIRESFEFYKKCLEKYGETRSQLKWDLEKIPEDEIWQAFGYAGVIDNHKHDHELDPSITFPVIFAGFMEAGGDRVGDYCNVAMDWVCLSEFNGAE